VVAEDYMAAAVALTLPAGITMVGPVTPAVTTVAVLVEVWRPAQLLVQRLVRVMPVMVTVTALTSPMATPIAVRLRTTGIVLSDTALTTPPPGRILDMTGSAIPVPELQ
jgi:hypothetical protein